MSYFKLHVCWLSKKDKNRELFLITQRKVKSLFPQMQLSLRRVTLKTLNFRCMVMLEDLSNSIVASAVP